MRIAALSIVVLLCSSSLLSASALQKCIENFYIGRENCPVQPATDFVSARAGRVSGTMSVPENLQKFKIDGRPLMVLDRKGGGLVVDSRYFTGLKRVDATRNAGGIQVVGRVLDFGLKKLRPRDIVSMLLESQIVGTYWHLHSFLCLENENDDARQYLARLTGTHVYCTNTCHNDPLDFSLKIDKETGKIALIKN